MNRKLIIGICAMESKARSKPMRNILDRLISSDEFEAIIFGDKVILDENIEEWPYCDFLISFFSKGFPLKKAIDYVALRNPFCVNDLPMQEILWDRRLVLGLLDAIGVPTLDRITTFHNDYPELTPQVLEILNSYGLELQTEAQDIQQTDNDTICSNGKYLKKPFVEKPVNGEDHNVYIYNQCGGVRKLFRKVGNKSSSYSPDEYQVRSEGSYVYEMFMESTNSEDIKVYTIGENFAHAETRKSPVVDGVVRRNAEGKEIRYVTSLTEEEKEIAKKITKAFGQKICGFDLLRVDGRSFVIDVNGWSFVKGNAYYYDKCAEVLRELFLNVAATTGKDPFTLSNPETQWKLKGFISVLRHVFSI